MSAGRKKAAPRAKHRPAEQQAPGLPGVARHRPGGAISGAVSAYQAVHDERRAANRQRRARKRVHVDSDVAQAAPPPIRAAAELDGRYQHPEDPPRLPAPDPSPTLSVIPQPIAPLPAPPPAVPLPSRPEPSPRMVPIDQVPTQAWTGDEPDYLADPFRP